MKALTVKQPWAWAIAHGGKNVENRQRRTHYRGPVAIHAGLSWSTRGADDQRVAKAAATAVDGDTLAAIIVLAGHPSACPKGAFIAVADLVGCHRQEFGCCPPWGDPGVWHWELSNVRALSEPIPRKGRLGLWNPPAEIVAQLSGVSR